MKHGGKRVGAGRKPAPDGTAKIAYGTKLDPVAVEGPLRAARFVIGPG